MSDEQWSPPREPHRLRPPTGVGSYGSGVAALVARRQQLRRSGGVERRSSRIAANSDAQSVGAWSRAHRVEPAGLSYTASPPRTRSLDRAIPHLRSVRVRAARSELVACRGASIGPVTNRHPTQRERRKHYLQRLQLTSGVGSGS